MTPRECQLEEMLVRATPAQLTRLVDAVETGIRERMAGAAPPAHWPHGLLFAATRIAIQRDLEPLRARCAIIRMDGREMDYNGTIAWLESHLRKIMEYKGSAACQQSK